MAVEEWFEVCVCVCVGGGGGGGGGVLNYPDRERNNSHFRGIISLCCVEILLSILYFPFLSFIFYEIPSTASCCTV